MKNGVICSDHLPPDNGGASSIKVHKKIEWCCSPSIHNRSMEGIDNIGVSWLNHHIMSITFVWVGSLYSVSSQNAVKLVRMMLHILTTCNIMKSHCTVRIGKSDCTSVRNWCGSVRICALCFSYSQFGRDRLLKIQAPNRTTRLEKKDRVVLYIARMIHVMVQLRGEKFTIQNCLGYIGRLNIIMVSVMELDVCC